MKKLSKNEWIAIGVSLLFVVYTLFGGNITSLFQNIGDEDTLANATQNNNIGAQVIVNDVVVGTGPEIREGELVSIHYILMLADGTVVQNSKDLGQPFEFVLGNNEVLPSFEEAIMGIKVGGVRTIIIPSELGYGTDQNGPIPANSTLIFTVEVLDAVNLPPQAM